SSRRRHTRSKRDWSSDVCSSDLLRNDAPALTQARVSIRLRDGRTLASYADGARGYSDRPATAQELTDKFRACAGRVLDPDRTDRSEERRVGKECGCGGVPDHV